MFTVSTEYKPIKAGVSFGQIFHIDIHQVKSEETGPRGPGRTLESLEALQGNSAGARDELEEAGPHLLVVPPNDLPEPDHLGALGSAVLQASVSLPVSQIYGAQTSDNLTNVIILDLDTRPGRNKHLPTPVLSRQKVSRNSVVSVHGILSEGRGTAAQCLA